MSKLRKKDEILESTKSEYQHQYCIHCGHTMTFNIKQKNKRCNWCGRLNKNNTKGWFIYNYYKTSKPEYKTIRIEGDLK